MKDIEKYFSLRPIKKEPSLKRNKNNQLNRNNNTNNNNSYFNTKTSENSFEMELDEMDVNDAKMAEEALAANIKLLKKQKSRLLHLQKILSRNVFLIPLCAAFSILSAVTIFGSTLTDHYESMNYDMVQLTNLIQIKNNNSLSRINRIFNRSFKTVQEVFEQKNKLLKQIVDEQSRLVSAQIFQTTPVSSSSNQINQFAITPSTHQNVITTASQSDNVIYVYDLVNLNHDCEVLTRLSISSKNITENVNYIHETFSGIWRTCNHLSDKTRELINFENCAYYRTTSIEIDDNPSKPNNQNNQESFYDPGLDLVRLHNAAACCTIVSYFLLIFSWFTGIVAAVTKKVPLSLATCVLNSLITVFILLLLAIFQRKILAEERKTECFDLRIVFDIVCQSRRAKFDYSYGITWLALIFTSINGFCWFQITKMQKLLFTHGFN